MYPNITGENPKSPPPPPPSAPPYNHQLPPPAYSYAINQPQPVVHNVQVVNIVTSGQWTTSLCGCFEDPGNCCITCCCPCIVFGQNAEIIDRNTTSCFCAGLVFFLLCHFGCPCFYSCTYRTKLRGQYTLPESPCGDFLVHCCCTPCAICQEYRELKHRGFEPSIGWIANAERMNRGITTVPSAITTPPVIVQGMPR